MAVTFIKDPALWTLSASLEVDDRLVSLTRYEDYFDDYSLDTASIGTLTSGNGSIAEVGGLRIHTPANADAAMWYHKTPLVTNQADVWSIRASASNVSSTAWPFMVKQGEPTLPVIEGEKPVIEAVMLIADVFRVKRRKADGFYEYWNESTGAWQIVLVNLTPPIEYSYSYEFQLFKSATGWTFKITELNTDTVICDTSAAAEISWADTYDNGNAYFVAGGDPFTTATFMNGILHLIHSNYPLTSETATMGQIDFNAIFELFPVTHELEPGASISWQYNKDGEGWVQPGAGQPADMEAALNGIHIGTLDLKATLLSDAAGEAWAGFDIGHGVMGGIGASFNMPIETLSINEPEVVEL